MKKWIFLITLLLSGCVQSQEQILKEQEEKLKNVPQQLSFDDYSLLEAFFIHASVVNVPTYSGVIKLVVLEEENGRAEEITELELKVSDSESTVAIGLDAIDGQTYLRAVIQTESSSVVRSKLLEVNEQLSEFTQQWDKQQETFARWDLFEGDDAQQPSKTYHFKLYLK